MFSLQQFTPTCALQGIFPNGQMCCWWMSIICYTQNCLSSPSFLIQDSSFAHIRINRVPKGFKAPGLWGKKCRAPGLQDRKTGALGLQGCILGLHLARVSIFVRAPSRKRLWAPDFTKKNRGFRTSKVPPFRP